MRQVTQLAGDRHRQRLPHASQQRPAQRLLAPGQATAAPSTRPGFYAPSSRPRPGMRSDHSAAGHRQPPATAMTTRRSP
jgi:hypothetical protein